MSAPTIITGGDLATVPGAKDKPDADRAYAARRASTAVAEAWCKPISPVPQWVKDIAIDMAVEYLANPTGAASTTRTIDDASRTVRFDGQRPRRAASFMLTDDERNRLCPKVRRPVGSIHLAVPGYQP